MTDLRALILESPALPSIDVSSSDVLVFLNDWYAWRERALRAVDSWTCATCHDVLESAGGPCSCD